MAEPTPPAVCISDADCLKVERSADGTLTLWSSRRPEQRITLDADEVPEWLRPVPEDLRTLAAKALRQHVREIRGWDIQEGADAVLAAVLPAHRRQVLDETVAALASTGECDCRWREKNLTLDADEQGHDAVCSFWPDEAAATAVRRLSRHPNEKDHHAQS